MYFTATWCSSCVKIADKISPLLSVVNSKGSFLKLITFRLDDDSSKFGYSDLKFKFMTSEKASEIATWLKVYHIPTLLVYDFMGRLVTSNGYNDMRSYKENTIEMWDRKMNI